MRQARDTHIVCIISQLLQLYANHKEAKMTEASLLCFQVFNYVGTILNIQYAVGNADPNDWHTEGRHEALYWLTIEVLSLYLYIVSAMIFLFRI